MKTISTYLLMAVAAVAPGIGGHWALAGEPHARSFPLSTAPDATEPAMAMGIVAFGSLPPTDSLGAPEWPCFTGGADADCASMPAGGVVVGMPYQYWNIKGCTTGTCGQVYWSFSSNSASGTVMVSETITQGSNIIYQSGITNFGQGTAPFVTFVWDEIGFGPNACSGCVAPVKGAAKITTTATIGTVTITGHAFMILQ
jgi:hypothetical protein